MRFMQSADNGGPGRRSEYHSYYYAAFVIDLTSDNFGNAMFHGEISTGHLDVSPYRSASPGQIVNEPRYRASSKPGNERLVCLS